VRTCKCCTAWWPRTPPRTPQPRTCLSPLPSQPQHATCTPMRTPHAIPRCTHHSTLMAYRAHGAVTKGGAAPGGITSTSTVVGILSSTTRSTRPASAPSLLCARAASRCRRGVARPARRTLRVARRRSAAAGRRVAVATPALEQVVGMLRMAVTALGTAKGCCILGFEPREQGYIAGVYTPAREGPALEVRRAEVVPLTTSRRPWRRRARERET
jgi:hypothetical protein